MAYGCVAAALPGRCWRCERDSESLLNAENDERRVRAGEWVGKQERKRERARKQLLARRPCLGFVFVACLAAIRPLWYHNCPRWDCFWFSNSLIGYSQREHESDSL